MIYGYARVSTIGQMKDGNSLEEQGLALREYGCTEIITEAFTGKTTDRPKFTALLSRLQAGDTLVVCKLDRFARSTIEGVQTVRNLFEHGVKVHILNVGLIEDNPTGNLILTVMLAFAEFERQMILERTRAGREVARQQPGYRDGRPKKYKQAQLEHAMQLLAEGMTFRRVEELTGISRSTLAREKRNGVVRYE